MKFQQLFIEIVLFFFVFLQQYVDDNRRYENSRSKNRIIRMLYTIVPCFGRFLGNYIVILYFVVKFTYIANTFLQIAIVSGLLGKSFWYFGIDTIHTLATQRHWILTSSKYFPSKLFLRRIFFLVSDFLIYFRHLLRNIPKIRIVNDKNSEIFTFFVSFQFRN